MLDVNAFDRSAGFEHLSACSTATGTTARTFTRLPELIGDLKALLASLNRDAEKLDAESSWQFLSCFRNPDLRRTHVAAAGGVSAQKRATQFLTTENGDVVPTTALSGVRIRDRDVVNGGRETAKLSGVISAKSNNAVGMI